MQVRVLSKFVYMCTLHWLTEIAFQRELSQVKQETKSKPTNTGNNERESTPIWEIPRQTFTTQDTKKIYILENSSIYMKTKTIRREDRVKIYICVLRSNRG